MRHVGSLARQQTSFYVSEASLVCPSFQNPLLVAESLNILNLHCLMSPGSVRFRCLGTESRTLRAATGVPLFRISSIFPEPFEIRIVTENRGAATFQLNWILFEQGIAEH